MKKICRKLAFSAVFLMVMLFAAGITFHGTTVETQAATTGWKTVSGKTYYYLNGTKKTGWLTLNGQKYYLNSSGVLQKGWFTVSSGTGAGKHYSSTSTGAVYVNKFVKVDGHYYFFKDSYGTVYVGWYRNSAGRMRFFYGNSKTYGQMATGWVSNGKGQKRYFHPSTGVMYEKTWAAAHQRYFADRTGIMYTGLQKVDGKYYYFDKSSGKIKKGYWLKENGTTRYFFSGDGTMAMGWVSNGKGGKRYFNTSNGYMYTGSQTVGGKKYYFSTSSGLAQSGWINDKYYDTSTFAMVTSTTKTISGVKYTFDANGTVTKAVSAESNTVSQTGTKTIKNYLAGALLPVGKALYVWGGGWNDSTRKGLSTTMTTFYNTQNSSYNYKSNGLNDLSVANRAKGFDCSGFVGWAAYQVMQTKSNVGSGYTVVSGEVGSYYKSLGWGSTLSVSQLASSNYKIYPGDVGYNSGHVWIYLGQCSDKSAVIVHSTPNAGVQIAGTCTPSGDYSSEAIALAKKYMAKYSGYSKYGSSFYHTSSGNYLRNGSTFRWNSSTLSDPNGYKNMTASQILADLFSK